MLKSFLIFEECSSQNEQNKPPMQPPHVGRILKLTEKNLKATYKYNRFLSNIYNYLQFQIDNYLFLVSIFDS